MAAQLGYCGLDSRRLPLSGTELRGCWAPAAPRALEAVQASAPTELPSPRDPGREAAVRLRDFVPVELLRDRRIVVVAPQADGDRNQPDVDPLPQVTAQIDQASSGLTLFGEVDQA